MLGGRSIEVKTIQEPSLQVPFTCPLFSLFLTTVILCGAAAGVLTLISWRSCRGAQHVSLCVWGTAKKR